MNYLKVTSYIPIEDAAISPVADAFSVFERDRFGEVEWRDRGFVTRAELTKALAGTKAARPSAGAAA